MRRRERARERGEPEKKKESISSFFTLIPQQTLDWIMLISRTVLLVLSSCVCVSVCVENADAPATERQGNSSSLTKSFQRTNRQRDAFKVEQGDNEEPRSSCRVEIKGSVSQSTASALSLQHSSKKSKSGLKSNTAIDSTLLPKSSSFQEVANGTVRLSRTRRSWIWNQFFVIEEYSGPEPVLLGRVKRHTQT